MDWWAGHLVMTLGLPVVGATLGTIWWSKPQWFKTFSLLVVTLTWLMLTVPVWMTGSSFTLSLFLMNVILAAAFVTVLGHHPNKETPVSLFLTLLFLGLGLSVVASQEPAASLLLAGLFGLLILALVRQRRPDVLFPWQAIGLLTLGLLSLLISLTASGHLRILTLLLPFAIVWPLLPVQGAFVASLRCLPGTLPPFLAVLLPSLGFHGLALLLPDIPERVLHLLWLAAIAGTLYGSLLALSQNSMEMVLAYAHLALGSIVWWYVTITQAITPGAIVYLGGLSLVICGLLLATQHLRARFGHLDLSVSHGLARIMPWFSTLFVLFITAAVGLPLFTLFSAFMDMLFGVSSAQGGMLAIVLAAWLMASWYFPQLMQQVLFGRLSPFCRTGRDLHLEERASLILLLALLVMLGITPSHWLVGAANQAVSTEEVSFDLSEDDVWKP